MRILFTSNYYPPFELGGWEQLTQEIAQRLAGRGHVTAVLTSRHRRSAVTEPAPGVYRLLHPESADVYHYHPSSWLRAGRRERENGRCLERVIGEFQPETVFVHSMWNLPWSLAWQVEQRMPGCTVYYVAGDWPYASSAHECYWGAPTRRPYLHWLKRLVGAVPLAVARRERRGRSLQFKHVLCVSEAVRQDLARYAKIPLERSQVVYNGIDVHQFAPPTKWDPSAWKGDAPAFAYAGSLMRAKGVHTAIEGFAQVAVRPMLKHATLTVIGDGDPQYSHRLRKLALDSGLGKRISFIDRVPHNEMPHLLEGFDCLIVPSHFEAMPRIVQEGMACGLVVVGTPTWGTKELLVEGETGLTFEPEDADGLAQQLCRLAADSALRARVARAGRQAVVQRFSLERVIDEIEAYLQSVIADEDPAGH